MKKNTWALLISFVLIGVIAFIVLREKNTFSSINDFDEFAVEDTANVTSIFIADRAGEEVTLIRNKNGNWWVKDKYKARKDAIELILKTLHQLEIYTTVSEDSYETVVKNLATLGTKVEVYKNKKEEPFKSYYIGSATPNRMGTYTLLEMDGEVSDIPYVTYVPTENGSIGSRFFADAELWRDRTVFNYDPKTIKSIEVKHFNDTNISFKVRHKGNAKFELENMETNEVFPLSSKEGINYFNGFSNIHYEYIDQKTPQNEMDSIYLSPPRTIITVIDAKGDSHVAKTFFMPIKQGATDNYGNPIDYNPERMYLTSNKIDLNMVVQNYVYDKLTPGFEDFDLSTNVEK